MLEIRGYDYSKTDLSIENLFIYIYNPGGTDSPHYPDTAGVSTRKLEPILIVSHEGDEY